MALLIAIGWHLSKQPGWMRRRDGPSAEALAWYRAQLDRWSNADMVTLHADGPEKLTPQMVERLLLPSLQDEEKVLPGDLSRKLFETVARHALARAKPDASAYLEAVEGECGRWITPSDTHHWTVTGAFLRHTAGVSLESTPPREALRLLAAHFLVDQRGAFAKIGAGVGGTRTRVFRVYSRSELMVKILRQPNDEHEYWYGSSHGAFRMRVPNRSVEEVIRQFGSALCAEVLMLAENQAGQRYTWATTWYWDPADRCWACESMVRTGGMAPVMLFF